MHMDNGKKTYAIFFSIHNSVAFPNKNVISTRMAELTGPEYNYCPLILHSNPAEQLVCFCMASDVTYTSSFHLLQRVDAFLKHTYKKS